MEINLSYCLKLLPVIVITFTFYQVEPTQNELNAKILDKNTLENYKYNKKFNFNLFLS